MRNLFLFMMVSLDGYFEGANHDLSWHVVDREFNMFAVKQLEGIGTLLFGRVTYQLFEDYWPKAAKDPSTSKEDLEIARMINTVEKIVFSKTLDKIREKANWKNVRLVRDVRPEEVDRLKQASGKDIAVFGSNKLATTLLELGLFDEIRTIVNPVAIGHGTPLFQALTKHVKLNLVKTQTFRSGNVLLFYNQQKP